MSVYYPSAVVDVALRFQEPPGQPGQAAETGKPNPTLAPPAKGSPVAALTQTDPLDPYSLLVTFSPASVQWGSNPAREADTGSATIEFGDMPFDPRSIRSAVVSIYAGNVPADDFAAGVQGSNEPTQGRRSYVQRTRANLRFVGHVDTWDYSSDGEQITMAARDFTGLLIDKQVPTTVLEAIQWGEPLPNVVAAVVHSFPATATMPVVWDATGPDGPQAPPMAQQMQRHVQGADGKTPTDKAQTSETTYWDLVTDLCVVAGVVPLIYLDKLYLLQPRTLFQSTADKAPTMVWGGNIERMSISRKFGRLKTQPVEVRCFYPGEKETAFARFPESDQAEADVQAGQQIKGAKRASTKLKADGTPSGKGGSITYRVKDVSHLGVTKDQLPKIAEGLYLELSHQQMEVTLDTADMASFGQDPTSADLLSLRAGDPVNVLVRDIRNPQGSLPLFNPVTLAAVQMMSPQELADDLVRRGIARTVAPALSRALKQSSRLSTFRTRKATHKLGTDGYSCSVQCAAFAEIQLTADASVKARP